MVVLAATGSVALEPLLPDPMPAGAVRGGSLPTTLLTAYGGDLSVPLHPDRPTLVANFVSTLDGVVSYATPEAAGGGEISGFFQPDRFVMGLLRALADVVLIGAGTLRAAPDETWTPEFIHPPSAAAFAVLRRQLNLSSTPVTVVVSRSGEVDLAHPGLAAPADVLVITSERGADLLARQEAQPNVEIRAVGSGEVRAGALLDLLAARGAGLVLCEGGPHLFGQLLSAGLVDELFLTLAPQLAGRSPHAPRMGLIEGTAFSSSDASWGRLVGLRRAADHLFARYRLTHQERKDR